SLSAGIRFLFIHQLYLNLLAHQLPEHSYFLCHLNYYSKPLFFLLLVDIDIIQCIALASGCHAKAEL
uniref:Uncharacterized protein n=1 Tax=Oryza brachyantha TaxID=4533 RepID=J3LEJ8_ORYBR